MRSMNITLGYMARSGAFPGKAISSGAGFMAYGPLVCSFTGTKSLNFGPNGNRLPAQGGGQSGREASAKPSRSADDPCRNGGDLSPLLRHCAVTVFVGYLGT